MRSNLIRIAVVSAAVLAGVASPVLAQTHTKHRTAPHVTGYTDPAWNSSNVSAHPYAPPAINNQPSACFTDEGYGRYASCDQAGS